MPQWRGAALLLCCACLCAGLEPGCVLGRVGAPVLLPCLHPHLGTRLNFSIEWRENDSAVFRSVWDADGNVETWSVNHVRIPADAPSTGDFSLELPAAHPKQDGSRFSLSLQNHNPNQSTPLCTVCLRIAASFSIPEVSKASTGKNESTYVCRTSGGYPQPLVHWLISGSQEPPTGSVSTQVQELPDSRLLNVTSRLTVNASGDGPVSCTVENRPVNETLTSTYGASSDLLGARALEGMWIFSTALCVVVALMVLAGLGYQIHLDKLSKRRKKEYSRPQRGRRYHYKQATEAMISESTETDV